MGSEHVSLSMFVVLPEQHIHVEGWMSQWLLLEFDKSWRFHRSSSLCIFSHLVLFCFVRDRTFVRIIYHYVGLLILCMLRSLGITQRLVNVFKPPLSHLFLSFPFGRFLVRWWISPKLFLLSPCSQMCNFSFSIFICKNNESASLLIFSYHLAKQVVEFPSDSLVFLFFFCSQSFEGATWLCSAGSMMTL